MKKNWYGFDHEQLNKVFPGGLTYLNDTCVYDEYYPVAIYSVKNPDRSKGHKEYILLTNKYVRGMTSGEIQPYITQDAIKCNKCNDEIYSVNRHDMRYCECGRVAIDGGRDYVKITGSDYTTGIINILTNKFTPDEH